MSLRQFARSRRLRLAVVLSALGVLATGCQGYVAGKAFDVSTGNSVSVADACKSHNLGYSCVGAVTGNLSGMRFVGHPTTGGFSNLPTCHSGFCTGGRVHAAGTGTWGTTSVAFTFTGFDADPSPHDTMTLTVSGNPPQTFNCDNCLTVRFSNS